MLHNFWAANCVGQIYVDFWNIKSIFSNLIFCFADKLGGGVVLWVDGLRRDEWRYSNHKRV